MRIRNLLSAALIALASFGLVLATKWTLEAADQQPPAGALDGESRGGSGGGRDHGPAFGERGGGGGGRNDHGPAFNEDRGGSGGKNDDAMPAFDERRGGGRGNDHGPAFGEGRGGGRRGD